MNNIIRLEDVRKSKGNDIEKGYISNVTDITSDYLRSKIILEIAITRWEGDDADFITSTCIETLVDNAYVKCIDLYFEELEDMLVSEFVDHDKYSKFLEDFFSKFKQKYLINLRENYATKGDN